MKSLGLESLTREGVGRTGSEACLSPCSHPSLLLCLTPHLSGLRKSPCAASMIYSGSKWGRNFPHPSSLPPLSISLLAWFSRIHSPLSLTTHLQEGPWEFWFCSYRGWDGLEHAKKADFCPLSRVSWLGFSAWLFPILREPSVLFCDCFNVYSKFLSNYVSIELGVFSDTSTVIQNSTPILLVWPWYWLWF